MAQVKAFLLWLLAVLLMLTSVGAFQESAFGGLFLIMAAVLTVPPVWQRLSSKSWFHTSQNSHRGRWGYRLDDLDSITRVSSEDGQE
jgi:hypothetical protein